MRPYDPDSKKPLLVGEMNPYGADPEFALYPFPAHASGGRLREILGLTLAEYMNHFDRINLCTGRWSAPKARPRAAEVLCLRRSPIVLLGRKVAGAFYPQGAPPAFTRDAGPVHGNLVFVLPHPSGLCREWNAPGAAQRARDLLREVMP